MGTINVITTYADKWITPTENDRLWKEVIDARKKLLGKTGEGNDFLGWIDYPTTITTQLVDRIQAEANRIRNMAKICVVIGIGGSYLGARAVIEALKPNFDADGNTQIVYAGHTLCEDYYADLLHMLDSNDYALVVISKSGTTTEPAIAFRLLKKHLESKYGKDEARNRIIAITDGSTGALHDIAKQEGYSTFEIPADMGGRFSVLCPVGLLPIAIAGFDIAALIAGAKVMQDCCWDDNMVESCPALKYASTRNHLYSLGHKVEMLAAFSPKLQYINEWWKQLYGESEGKRGKGILPHSLCYTTDLHSMGQYLQEGERIMFETIICVQQSQKSISIPFDSENADGLNYLNGKSLSEVNHCAEKGTTLAHHEGGVPVIRIEIPKIDEDHLGQLIYFFEFACGISGYMLGVNPFNQPGVEAYKRNMFALLGKPGLSR